MIDTILYWYTYLFISILMVGIVIKIPLKIIGKYDEVVSYPVQIEELVTIPFMMLAFVAAFGYLEKVAIFSPLFWQCYVALFLLQQVAAFWLPKQKFMRNELSTKAYVLANAAGIVTSLPLYYIIIQYAYYPGTGF